MKRYLATGLMATGMLLAASLSHAASFTITANNGVWDSWTYQGTGCAPSPSGGGRTLSWGDGNGGSRGCGSQSSYKYDPRSTSFTVETDEAFRVGQLTHTNAAITGANLTTAQLLLSLSISGIPIGFDTTFSFSHNETPNPQGDHVSLSLGSPILFSYMGSNYYFELLGFEACREVRVNRRTTTVCEYVDDFWTKEGKNTKLNLYGKITEAPGDPEEPTVPEPTSLLLTGAALVFAGRRFRRR